VNSFCRAHITGGRQIQEAIVATATRPEKKEKERENWIALVEQLVHEVEGWAAERKWPVYREDKQIHESRLGAYTLPVLGVLAPAGHVQLEPVARYVARGDGRVDLLAWPSLNRMMLIRVGDRWVVKTDSGVEWPEKWNRKTFIRLVDALNAAP
jgi:hypothetical protein